jgi:hypothetical protein
MLMHQRSSETCCQLYVHPDSYAAKSVQIYQTSRFQYCLNSHEDLVSGQAWDPLDFFDLRFSLLW